MACVGSQAGCSRVPGPLNYLQLGRYFALIVHRSQRPKVLKKCVVIILTRGVHWLSELDTIDYGLILLLKKDEGGYGHSWIVYRIRNTAPQLCI